MKNASRRSRADARKSQRDVQLEAPGMDGHVLNLLDNLAHELRTPLTAMLSSLYMLRRHGRDEASFERALEVVEQSAREEARIVQDLLEVAALRRGTLCRASGRVELGSLVQATVAESRPEFAARNIRLELRIEAHPLPVEGDGEQLREVVRNLLNNAVKFSTSGGRIEVVLERRGGHAQLSIRDDGVGLSPEQVPRVFDWFWQADSSSTRPYGGLGLGLPLARALVRLHGGALEVASDGENRGTRVTVRLPVRGTAIGTERSYRPYHHHRSALIRERSVAARRPRR